MEFVATYSLVAMTLICTIMRIYIKRFVKLQLLPSSKIIKSEGAPVHNLNLSPMQAKHIIQLFFFFSKIQNIFLLFYWLNCFFCSIFDQGINVREPTNLLTLCVSFLVGHGDLRKKFLD